VGKNGFHGARATVRSFVQADVSWESERGETSETVATQMFITKRRRGKRTDLLEVYHICDIRADVSRELRVCSIRDGGHDVCNGSGGRGDQHWWSRCRPAKEVGVGNCMM
jgi:hypothetical protein